MARLGMDVTQITNDGNQMKNVGDNELPSLISAVESLVQQIQGQWHGDDANSFVDAWNGTFKPTLTTIASEVSNHGGLALTNAQQQTTASQATTIA